MRLNKTPGPLIFQKRKDFYEAPKVTSKAHKHKGFQLGKSFVQSDMIRRIC